MKIMVMAHINPKVNWGHIHKSNKNSGTRIAFVNYHTCHLARLRISAHILAIRTWRHARPKVLVDQRLCKMWDTGEMEDEMHFITGCNKLRQIRQNIFEKIQNVCPNYGALSSEDKFSNLMSSGGSGSVLKLCASMIGQI